MVQFISINNTHHIPLPNHENLVCYLLVTLHKLQSSPTLVNFMKSYATTDPLLTLVVEYAKLDENNAEQVYLTIKEKLNYLYTNYVSFALKNGYHDEVMLYFIFIPLLRSILEEHLFEKIIGEFHLAPFKYSSFNLTLRLNEPFFRTEAEQQRTKQLYSEMETRTIGSDDDKDFVCDAMIIRTPSNNGAGHVVSLIRGNDRLFYVLDDGVHLMLFGEYVSHYIKRILSLKIKNINKETLEELNQVMVQNKLSLKFDFRQRSGIADNTDAFKSVGFNRFLPMALSGGSKERKKPHWIVAASVIPISIIIIVLVVIGL